MMNVSLKVFVFALGMAFASSGLAADAMYGVLMVVKGSVKIQNTAKQQTDAKVGGKVMPGDTVITGADSRAKIVMSDRNVINVSPDTEIVISKYENDAASGSKNVEMNLLKGKVRNNVEQVYDGDKNKFQIKTPTAVAGVRGTQFLAGFNPATKMSSIVTFKGSVTFGTVNAAGKFISPPVEVKKGEWTEAAPNTPPPAPKPVPKEEMNKLDKESTASLQNKETNSSSGGEQKREMASDGTAPAGGPEAAAPPQDLAAPTAPAMIDSKDMDMGMAKDIKPVVLSPGGPPPLMTPPPAPRAPTSDIIKDINRSVNGNTRVIIQPTTPN